MPRDLHASLMKPLVALATPGMYLFYKYNQYKRQQQEQSRRKVTEKELAQLNHKIDKLLAKLDEHEPEMATTQEEECVVCISAKASMQTYPCGHQVVCRKCFVKTIQMAVSQRLLPLRCVICRTKILRLKQSGASGATSVSMSASSSSCGGRSLISHSYSHSSQLTSYSSSSASSYSTSCSTSSASAYIPHSRSYSVQRHLTVVSEDEDDFDSSFHQNAKGHHRTGSYVHQHPHHRHYQLLASASPPPPSRGAAKLRSASPSSVEPPTVKPQAAALKAKSKRSPSPGSKTAPSSTREVVPAATAPPPKPNNNNSSSSVSAKSIKQPAIVKEHRINQPPEVIYFKPVKEKTGSRKSTSRMSHKLPSLPKVTIRSRSLSKQKKNIDQQPLITAAD